MQQQITPQPIRELVERAYPHFFSVPRLPLEIAAHLCLILERDREGERFKIAVEHIAGKVRVTLTWLDYYQCSFVATDRQLHAALFQATEAAMNDPRCSAWFQR